MNKKRFIIKIEIKDKNVIVLKEKQEVGHINEIIGMLHLIMEEILERYDYED